MKIIIKKINEIKKYKNNPRFNEYSVDEVAKSIKEFGFKVPILIDKNSEIICGHTRYDACIKLGIKEVPCIEVEDLTEEQIKAFRLADNKVSEFSTWDYRKLEKELESVDVSLFDFNMELDIDDDDFINEEEIVKEKKKKQYICPECGEIFE